jgi:hypothetical protein
MKKTFLCALLLVLPGSVWGTTSLWEVRSGGSLAYLGGTCHVLRPADYPLPAEFGRAYNAVQEVVFEADPGQMNTPEVQQMIMAGAIYQDGRTLADVLSPATYNKLKNYCQSRRITFENLTRFKPSILAVTLLTLELQKRGVDAGGVDQFFHEKAVADGKSVEGLETVRQQVDFILNLGQGNEDAFMASCLEDMEQLDEVFDRLIAAWRTGDEATLEALTSTEVREKFPTVYKMLFVDRNRAWLPAIEEYLRTPQKELILVGAGHLVGEDGLLAMLRRRGYQVRKLQ